MKVYQNKTIISICRFFGSKTIEYLNLFSFCIIYNTIKPDAETINHEQIHSAQMRELLFLGFYLMYVYFWIKDFIKYRSSSHAYYVIPFECEAYESEYNKNYLKTRKHFAWIKFVGWYA